MKVTSTHKWTATGVLAFVVLLASSVAAWEVLRLPRWEWRQDAIDTQRGNVEKHLRLAGYSEQTREMIVKSILESLKTDYYRNKREQTIRVNENIPLENWLIDEQVELELKIQEFQNELNILRQQE